MRHCIACLIIVGWSNNRVRDKLRVGLGSPSMFGCVAARGDNIKWSTFTQAQTGILQALRALDLDLIILPGARLPNNFKT